MREARPRALSDRVRRADPQNMEQEYVVRPFDQGEEPRPCKLGFRRIRIADRESPDRDDIAGRLHALPLPCQRRLCFRLSAEGRQTGKLPGLATGEIPVGSRGRQRTVAAPTAFAVSVLLGDGQCLLVCGLVELGDSKAWRLRWLRRLLCVQPQHHTRNNATAYHTGDDGGCDTPEPLAAVLLQLLVVGFPLLLVLEKLVGCDNLSKLQLGGRIAGVEVGVERLGGLAECGPNCFLVGMRWHAQNIIECVHGCPSARAVSRPT